jgi:drug/metabolite transporter (DMT)-like permease
LEIRLPTLFQSLVKQQNALSIRGKGISAALLSAIFLGLAPVFGKAAIESGMSSYAVVALRTFFAMFLLVLVIVLRKPSYLYIYPAGLLGCFLAGVINGLGSLFYYGSLSRIDASLGQLIYSLYPLFVVVLLWLDGQPPSRMFLIRLSLMFPAVYLLSRAEFEQVDLIGMLMMLISSALYALHLPVNQRVLYDMPAPTVTLYTLLAMSLVVVPAYFISLHFGGTAIFPRLTFAWWPVLGLTLVTFFSRLTLFQGVKHLGGMQTALLGLSEMLITLVFSFIWLGERLSWQQWLGVTIMLSSIGLAFLDKSTPPGRSRVSWLSWLRPPGLPRDIPWPLDQ